MAIQQLKVWAKQIVPDSVKGNNQVREIRDEEWLQGWGRLLSPTIQQLNSLFRLITQHTSPTDIAPYLYPNTKTIQSNMLEMNGQSITEEETPVLFDTYSTNLPDMTLDYPTGFIYVVRKQ